MKSIGIYDFLDNHRGLIDQSRREPIYSKMAAYGIDNAVLDEGQALYVKSNDLQMDYDAAKKEVDIADDEVSETWEEATRALIPMRTLVRALVIRQPLIAAQLHLKGAVPRSHAGWLHFADRFYASLHEHPQVRQRLLGIDAAEGLVQKFRQILAKREVLQQEQREAKVLRDEAHNALYDWGLVVKTIARLVVVDYPGYRRGLGL